MACRSVRSPGASVSRRARSKSMLHTVCVSAQSECSPSAAKHGTLPRPGTYCVGRESSMNSNKAEVEAAEWLARLDGDNISSQHMAEFARWKAADPRHIAAYARLAATWQALERIQAVRPVINEPIDKDYLIDARRVAYRDWRQPDNEGFSN